MKARIFTALLAIVSFVAGAAMRPMSKPSVVFRRPFEVSGTEPIPGPFLHVCICGQKIACAAEHGIAHQLQEEMNHLETRLVEAGILSFNKAGDK